jgi:tRNA-2-methylthio-N6-dimethylallyladenosine synthase
MRQTPYEEQRSFYIETYGCQMNIAESHVLDASFLQQGFRAAVHPEEADIVIINTCSVRKTAENRIWGRIGFYKHLKQSKELLLIITGCMAERLGDEIIKKEPAVDLVIGTNDKTDILHMLGKDLTDSEEYQFASSYYKNGEKSAFVPIMNGCNNFCSYCIVPYVRGREVSRPIEQVVQEIHRLSDQGVREVMFLGQNVNSYAYHDRERDTVLSFPGLLKEVLEDPGSIQWFRFMSAHPKDFSWELIELIASEDRLCKNIHLPLQSGSSTILKAMNRKYDAQQYLSIIERLRRLRPDITFSTDIMVGFPGEREEDLQQTLDMMREASYIEAFMYYYNPREGTASTSMPGQIPDAVKLERLQRVIDLQKELTLQHKSSTIGKTVRVICDSISKKNPDEFSGHTEHNERIVFPRTDSVTTGDMISLKIEQLVGTTYKGAF